MHSSKSKILLLFLWMNTLLVGAQLGLADTIKLKSGKTIEGVIVEKTDKYVKIDFQGVILTYYNDEIVDVGGTSSITSAPNEAQGELYANDEYGFVMRGPKGWFMHVNPSIRGQRVLFNKEQFSEEVFPGISIAIDSLKIGQRSLDDFAQGVIAHYNTMGMLTIEGPKEVFVGNQRGLRFIMESPVGKSGYSFRHLQYLFQKNDKIISIMYANKSQDFDKNIQDCESAINSFKLTVP